jgi:hypothetical protein
MAEGQVTFFRSATRTHNSVERRRIRPSEQLWEKKVTYILLTIVFAVGHLGRTTTTGGTAFVDAMIHTSVAAASRSKVVAGGIVRIAEPVWREAARQHADQVKVLLEPGLTSIDNPINSGRRLRQRQPEAIDDTMAWITALNPKHPTYNFLVEYYGLKGLKGPRRLARWSPDPALMLRHANKEDSQGKDYPITSLDQLLSNAEPEPIQSNTALEDHASILLEGATEDDLFNVLHKRGAEFMQNGEGVCYSPTGFFFQNSSNNSKPTDIELVDAIKKAAPYQWYESILDSTLQNEPILHCHGLHEWAMQYYPDGAAPPPSAKYQSHSMPLRASREVINKTVERRGISCTHVDALRFFAPAAGPLNHHGSSLLRQDQLKLEQPGCVHAHMDLLKIALKLSPFCDPRLLVETLDVALQARKLDVAASPYDASEYGLEAIPVETKAGRAAYRAQQTYLMTDVANPVRRKLLNAYKVFLKFAMQNPSLSPSSPNEPNPFILKPHVDKQRFAKAEPGGLPWRQNLVPRS